MADLGTNQNSTWTINGIIIEVIRKTSLPSQIKYAVAKYPDGEIFLKSDEYINTIEFPITDKRVAYTFYEKYLKNKPLPPLEKGTLDLNSYNKNAPLIVEYGGHATTNPYTGKKEFSEEYMRYYLPITPILTKYSVWIAKSDKAGGKRSSAPAKEGYNELNTLLKQNNITPSKKILYLFSGGYVEGQNLINAGLDQEFNAFYLVDIWIGSSGAVDPYIQLAKKYKGKVFYFYTSAGAGSEINKDKLKEAVGPGNSFNCNNGVKVNGVKNDHMNSNITAVQHILGKMMDQNDASDTGDIPKLIRLGDIENKYSNIKLNPDRADEIENDTIPEPLLIDVQAAALASNVFVTIDFAKSNHGLRPRHSLGEALDLSTIRTPSTGNKYVGFTDKRVQAEVDVFVNEMVKLGYSRNTEQPRAKRKKAVLWKMNDGSHYNHVHVSWNYQVY